MNYYAHTAKMPNGSNDHNDARWQPLAVHLRNVVALVAKFGVPFGLAGGANVAGLLYNL
jgi:hypothetical protein